MKEPNHIVRQCDYLSPALSRLTDADPGHAREEAVLSTTLFSRVAPGNLANLTSDELFMVMLTQNPHTTEEVVYLLRTAPRPTPPEYKVVHARAKQRLMSKDTNVGADFTEAAIDAETVQALERAWGPMTLHSRWPNREGSIAMMKFGGTTYTFDYRGDNVYGQGYTVSPERGTCASGLVEIGNLLTQFADEQDERKRAVIRMQLLRQSDALSERAAK